MKCHNFFCNQHDKGYRTNCAGYVIPGSGNHAFMKNCQARKRYNRISTIGGNDYDGIWESGKRFYKERNRYHRRNN